MKKLLILASVWICASGSYQTASAQSADSVANDAQQLFSTIATYPKDMRDAILDVAQYPQVLVKLEKLQARSSQSFQDMVSGYSRADQESLYDVSRYPDRVALLAKNGGKTREQAKRYVEDVPAATQEHFLSIYQSRFSDLQKMSALFDASQETMETAISAYPASTQNNFRKVIGQPDVMSLLTDNIDLTVSLGQDYKANPSDMTAQLDATAADVARQKESDLANYKKTVENDPALQEEMKSAGANFSSSYSQNGTAVDSYPTSQPVVNNYNGYNYNPYPYWFSYPYWYSSAIWYPRPYYYYTGYYYGAGGRLVIWGLPTRAYSSWYFNVGYHHYPYMYNHYAGYYRRPWNNSFAYQHRSASQYRHYGNTSYRNGRSTGQWSGRSSDTHYNSGRSNNQTHSPAITPNAGRGINNPQGRTRTSNSLNRQLAPSTQGTWRSGVTRTPSPGAGNVPSRSANVGQRGASFGHTNLNPGRSSGGTSRAFTPSRSTSGFSGGHAGGGGHSQGGSHGGGGGASHGGGRGRH